ncbi:thyrotropin-releasing hormone receptor 1-like [Tropilaelaps mercedesae]|uniref:Thyrotropin-releasing hormone receptor n=1 Tax=Tropilaelaps mercedesae TaxID=418985 RepID=A0A1V9XLD9_9ACAR|nr:thyrotropin-releasing hormone receptor 1-like [Tropilaelaps mercedesae]
MRLVFAVREVVKMLIVVVVLFATLWLPYRVLLVYNSFASKPYLELWYLMLCKTLIFVNSAINPVLYNAMSVKFRHAFRRTLSCAAKNTLTSEVTVPLDTTNTVLAPPSNSMSSSRTSICRTTNSGSGLIKQML